jgi:hypothetical protein
MKLNRQYNRPALWDWLSARLPSGLEAKDFPIGYGRFAGIYRRGEAPGFFKRALEFIGEPVAEVLETEILLNFPEYFSDFEDLIRQWEKETGLEITLSYWESPKDVLTEKETA